MSIYKEIFLESIMDVPIVAVGTELINKKTGDKFKVIEVKGKGWKDMRITAKNFKNSSKVKINQSDLTKGDYLVSDGSDTN